MGNKDWSYAKLSSDVSKHGGPEKYIRTIKDVSRKQGKKEGIAEGAAGAAIILLPVIIPWIKDKYHKIKDKIAKNKQEKLDAIEAENKIKEMISSNEESSEEINEDTH